MASHHHCILCFDSLYYHFERMSNVDHIYNAEDLPPSHSIPCIPMQRCPLFVTWQKDGRLRGCIGRRSEEGSPMLLLRRQYRDEYSRIKLYAY